MGKWLQSFLSQTPKASTDTLAILGRVSSMSVDDISKYIKIYKDPAPIYESEGIDKAIAEGKAMNYTITKYRSDKNLLKGSKEEANFMLNLIRALDDKPQTINK